MDNVDDGDSSVVPKNPETERIDLYGYREYQEFFQNWKGKPTYVFFTCTESPTSGYSWCPLCTQVNEMLEKRCDNVTLVVVHVGSQEEWEDSTNPFKLDKVTPLRMIPTLLRHDTGKRLEGVYCLKPELLDVLFQTDCEFDA